MALRLIKRDPEAWAMGKDCGELFLDFFERKNEQKSFLFSTQFLNFLDRIRNNGALQVGKERDEIEFLVRPKLFHFCE